MQIDTSKISKTTVNGVLQLAIVSIIAYLALPAGVKAPVIALAVLKAIVCYLQKDAGEQEAIPQGGGPAVMMASHETPNDPNAKPVVKP